VINVVIEPQASLATINVRFGDSVSADELRGAWEEVRAVYYSITLGMPFGLNVSGADSTRTKSLPSRPTQNEFEACQLRMQVNILFSCTTNLIAVPGERSCVGSKRICPSQVSHKLCTDVFPAYATAICVADSAVSQ